MNAYKLISRNRFNWRKNRLYVENRYTGAEIVQDDRYPQMWRVKYKDTVSDMVNRTRAKDAALYVYRSEQEAAG